MAEDYVRQHMVVADFAPAPGRNVVYCYPEDVADYNSQFRKYLGDGDGEPRPEFVYRGGYQFRPAQIVRSFESVLRTCNLVVFVDGTNDSKLEPGASFVRVAFWKTSVPMADNPERAQAFRYYPRVPIGV